MGATGIGSYRPARRDQAVRHLILLLKLAAVKLEAEIVSVRIRDG